MTVVAVVGHHRADMAADRDPDPVKPTIVAESAQLASFAVPIAAFADGLEPLDRGGGGHLPPRT